MTISRRIVLGFYGLALGFVFVWVPWRGGPTIRGATTEAMGYGFVWSGPRRPAAFAEYDGRLAEYVKRRSEYDKAVGDPLGFRTGIVGYTPAPGEPQPPREPEGYSEFPYKLATASIDYERVLLEFGALSGLLLAALVLTYEKRNKSGERE